MPEPGADRQCDRCKELGLEPHLVWDQEAGLCLFHSKREDKKEEFTKAINEMIATGNCKFRGFVFPTWFSFSRQALKDADFIKATFQGAADFRGATFQGDAYFWEATFQGVAYFFEATFQADAGFLGATFQADAGFVGALFRGNDYFSGATFQGAADFRGAIFQGVAHFSKAMFQGDADFGRATFQGAADFRGAIFQGNAGFTFSTFGGETDFTFARFEGAADFRGGWAEVPGKEKAISTLSADLEASGKTIFLDNASDFPNKGIIRVEKELIKYTGKTGNELTGATRGYSGTLGIGHPAENEVKLEEKEYELFSGEYETKFLRVSFERPELVYFYRVNLSRCQFLDTDLKSVNFIGITQWHKKGWRNALWDEDHQDSKDMLPELMELYRQLKQNHEERRDWEGANHFHYGQMEMQRKNKGRPLRERILLNIYWALSGYGVRYDWTLIWLFFMTLMFAAVYTYWLGGSMNEGLRHAIRLMTLIPREVSAGLPAPWWLTTPNSLSGASLIALLILALRRRFRF